VDHLDVEVVQVLAGVGGMQQLRQRLAEPAGGGSGYQGGATRATRNGASLRTLTSWSGGSAPAQ
jgi:hypothetical protein